MSNSGRFDINEIRKQLAGRQGRQYWRSLDELADTKEFRDFLHSEFPDSASDDVSRRTFLKFMGASLALAGLTACTPQPDERIVPYVRQPEQILPGRPLY